MTYIGFTTFLTVSSLFSTMCSLMYLEMNVICKDFITLTTFIRFPSCTFSFLYSEMTASCKGLSHSLYSCSFFMCYVCRDHYHMSELNTLTRFIVTILLNAFYLIFSLFSFQILSLPSFSLPSNAPCHPYPSSSYMWVFFHPPTIMETTKLYKVFAILITFMSFLSSVESLMF